MRHRLPWLLALPLMMIGTWTAHTIGRSFAQVGASAEADEVGEHVGHAVAGPFGHPVALSALLTPFVVMALVLLVIRVLRPVAASWRGASPWWFLVMPPLAYIVGESVERLASGASLGIHGLQEPGLLLALAVQIPFGIAAYLIARLLLTVVQVVASMLARPITRPRCGGSRVLAPASSAPLRRPRMVGARGVRGPPRFVSSV